MHIYTDIFISIYGIAKEVAINRTGSTCRAISFPFARFGKREKNEHEMSWGAENENAEYCLPRVCVVVCTKGAHGTPGEGRGASSPSWLESASRYSRREVHELEEIGRRAYENKTTARENVTNHSCLSLLAQRGRVGERSAAGEMHGRPAGAPLLSVCTCERAKELGLRGGHGDGHVFDGRRPGSLGR